MKLCSAPREHFMISQQQLCQQPLVFFPVHLFFCQQVACPTFVEQIYLYNWEISQMLTNYSAAAQDCSTLACLPLKCYVLLWSVPCWLPWAASYISTQDFQQRWTALWWWRNILWDHSAELQHLYSAQMPKHPGVQQEKAYQQRFHCSWHLHKSSTLCSAFQNLERPRT